MTVNVSEPVELKSGLWWVGSGTPKGTLYCNPYLLIQGDSALLFDPGSVIDGEQVINQVKKLIPIESIDAIVASHQDPDLCAAIPMFEQHGFKGEICCHERSAMLIAYYGIKSDFYLVNQNQFRYQLADGSFIQFLYAPYLHFPGAIMTYLPTQRALISGDLFGAVTEQWELYANEDYPASMIPFHETYMPSHEILSPVMNQLLAYEIELICPQHGSVIKDNIKENIELLMNLTCGFFLKPLQERLVQEGGYTRLCERVLQHYYHLYGGKAVREVFAKSPFIINYSTKTIGRIELPEEQMWDAFFEQVRQKKGAPWLIAANSLAEQISRQYAIPLPKAYESVVLDAQKERDILTSKYQVLEVQKTELENNLKHIEETLARCPVTKLFNQNFYDLFIDDTLRKYQEQPYPFALLLLSIDNLADINLDFGSTEGDNTMRTTASIVAEALGELDRQFRLEGGVFAIFLPQISKIKAIEKANTLRNSVADSEKYIVPTTVSMGVFYSDEITSPQEKDIVLLKQIVTQTARFRLRLAKKRGRNSLIYDSSQTIGTKSAFSILLIDEQGIQRDIIQRNLERQKYQVTTVTNGLSARRLLDEVSFDLVISEMMIPKVSSFTLRKELLATSGKKRVPFIMMSANKNETSVKRAMGLGITHFLQKPVMMAELLGIVGYFEKISAEREG